MGVEVKVSDEWNEIADKTPTGAVTSFVGASIPVGWLECNGDEVAKTDHEDLYNVIQDTWGTPASGDNFVLPDLRGAFLRGAGTHTGQSGLTMENGTAYAGPNVGSFQEDLFQGHKHQISDPGHKHSVKYYHEWANWGGNRAAFHSGSSSGSQVHTNTTGVTVEEPTADPAYGSPRVDAETRPFAAGVKFIIKT